MATPGRSNSSFESTYELKIKPHLKLILVSAVLLASGLLGLISNDTLSIYVIAGIVGFGTLLVYKKSNPSLGLILLIPISMFIPITIGTGSGSSLNAAILGVLGLTAIWLLEMIIEQREIKLVSSHLNMPLFGLVVVATLSLLSGQLPWFNYAKSAPLTAQIGGLAVFWISVLAFLLAANRLKDIKWLEWMMWLYFILGSINIIGKLFRPTRRIIFQVYQIGSDASIFWIWLIALAGSMALFNTRLHRNLRYALGVLLVIAIYQSGVLAYEWKSGWLPASISLLVVLWVGFPKQRAIFMLLGIAAVLLNLTGVESTITGNEDYSLLTRWEAWGIVLDISSKNLILGLGPANYYWYTALYPILGYNVEFNSHNNYLDILAQTGIFGLFFYVLFLVQFGRLAWILLRSAQEGFEKAFIIACLGGLAGTVVTGMLGDWVIPFVYNVGLVGFRSSMFGWLFMGALVAVEQIIKQRNAALT